MPNICSKCNEYTKIRKRRYFEDLVEYICKKCEDATRIVYRKFKEDRELERIKKIEDWIKIRDKLLKEELINKGRDLVKLEENIKQISKKWKKNNKI